MTLKQQLIGSKDSIKLVSIHPSNKKAWEEAKKNKKKDTIVMPYSLVTKSSENWTATKSGNMNKLNTFCLFDTDNEYGFPEVKTKLGFSPKELLPFNVSRRKTSDKDNTVHFFLDDYMFESVWTNPRRYIDMFHFYNGIVSPTFSVWSNQPYSLNLFNIYRNRWLTRFYQESNIPVLVDVRWADENSYPYCFSGIEKGSPIIINTVGTRNRENREVFVRGFEPMLKAIEPSKLFIYGECKPLEFDNYFSDITYYQSFWSQRREGITKMAHHLIP